jgi:hypothetical protein
MKLPIPLLLYLVAFGLLGWSGWTVWKSWPKWRNEVRNQAHDDGHRDAKEGMTRGRQQNPDVTDWLYSPTTANWWAGLKLANLTGKLPPPPPEALKPSNEAPPPVAIDLRPLDEVIELIALTYDGQFAGKGGDSLVIVRFKPEANVEPPEWWLRENQPPQPGGASPNPRGPADVIAKVASTRPTNAAPTTAPSTAKGPARPPMPVASPTGPQYVQKVWVDGQGDPRRAAQLWPVKSNDGRVLGNIRLVRVAPDAQSAFFVRELPPPRAGEPAPEPKEEELIKTAMNLDQGVLSELRKLQGRAPVASGPTNNRAPAAASGSGWTETEETRRIGDAFHIGRADERAFAEDPDRIFEKVTFDAYQSSPSSKSNVRGLVVRNVDNKLAQQFGVAAGDVLIEVNGRKVESQAQALQQGKTDYRRGVRTFVSKWMSNGQVVERTYQAPNR